MPQRFGCLGCMTKLVLVGVFGVAVVYAVALVTDPWAFHIGGQWTPLLTWRGSGKLLTKGGNEYPLYLYLYPSSHFSNLRRENLRPTGGLRGYGWICTSAGVTQQLRLSGTICGGWWTTEGSLMAFRLVEPTIFNVGQKEGFFDLAGRWNGPQLVMDQGRSVPDTFRSGLRIEHASITLAPATYSNFKSVCANAAPAHK